MIDFTPRAIAELARLKENYDSSSKYVRIKIVEGGCLDLVYQLDFSEECDAQDLQFAHDSGLIIITDQKSSEHLEDLTIDYLEDMMGGAFQFDNPEIEHHCNCGLSFSPESKD